MSDFPVDNGNMATVTHYDLTLDPDNMEDGATKIIKRLRPTWDLERLQFQHFTEGLCNILVGCYQPGDKDAMILVRVFGEKTELIIDREAEKETFNLLSKVGCAPPLHCTFNNGMAYGFLKGEPLDQDMAKDKNIRTLVAKEMARFHSLKKNLDSGEDNSNPKSFFLKKMENYLTLVPEKFQDEQSQKLFTNELTSKSALQQEFDLLRQHLEALTCDVVFSHNDLLLQNIIFDRKTNKIGFIDYEYAFYNHQSFDIGNHFNKYAGVGAGLDYSHYPDREYQLSWIRTYLEEYYKVTGQTKAPSDKDIERLYVQVNKCALASHYLWGVWALVLVENATNDFNYLGYAVSQFKEYFKRRDNFLSLEEP